MASQLRQDRSIPTARPVPAKRTIYSVREIALDGNHLGASCTPLTIQADEGVITMIRKITLVLGLLTVTSVLVATASPAFAEFTSHNESTEGSITAFALNIEEIGATINCGSLESGPTWQIRQGGEPAEVGSVLALKFKSLAKCVLEYTESKKVKEVNATSNECEWEMSEPGKENAVALTVVSTCVIKPELAETCEVKIEPKENKNRETVDLFDTGEKSESLDLNLNLTKVTVTASGKGCTSAGIKSTSSAKVSGAMEAKQVQPGMAAPQFILTAPTVPLTFNALNQKRELSVVNISAGAAATPTRAGVSNLVTGLQFGFFKSENKKVSECATTMLNEKESCKMEIELMAASPNRVTRGAVQYIEGANRDQMLLIART
jgi:hypothetical protein